jgi:hypothetical protein
MLRTIKISLFGVLALGVANAGTIVPVNLTTSSVGVCQGLTLPCTPSSYTTGSYMNKVFTSYVPNGETGGNGSPVASNSAQNVQTGTSTTPFILAAQSSPADNTFVSPPTAGNDVSVVVNLGGYSQGAGNTVANNTAGVFDIDAIYTMIQANMVTAGDTGLTVTLNGYDATGTTAESYTFTLTAGTDYRGSNSTSSVTSTDAGSGITPAPVRSITALRPAAEPVAESSLITAPLAGRRTRPNTTSTCRNLSCLRQVIPLLMGTWTLSQLPVMPTSQTIPVARRPSCFRPFLWIR